MQVYEAAGADDVAAVRVLMREYQEFLLHHPTGSAHFCIGGFEKEMAGLPGRYVAPGGLYLAKMDGEPAGCVGLRELRPAGLMAQEHAQEGGLALEVKRLWVRPAARGYGAGRRLMEAAVDHARRAGASEIYLDTVPAAMPEATAMYEGMGFARVARYNDNDLAGVAYLRLRLGSPVPVREPAEVTDHRPPTN